jgi:uncharacterized protein (TIGR02246 family)
MRRTVLALCLLLPATAPALAQTRSTGEAAIRNSVAAYQSAVNQRDARAIAGLFTRDADAVYFDSPRFVGRDSIAKAQKETISSWPSTRRFSLEVTNIRFLGSDLALVETLARFSEGEMTSNRGTILMARRDGKWLWEALRVYPAQGG